MRPGCVDMFVTGMRTDLLRRCVVGAPPLASGILALCLCGCGDPISIREVVGTYGRAVPPYAESLVMKEGGIFVQAVTNANGQAMSLTNTWKIVGSEIVFHELYIVFDPDLRKPRQNPRLFGDVHCSFFGGKITIEDTDREPYIMGPLGN